MARRRTTTRAVAPVFSTAAAIVSFQETGTPRSPKARDFASGPLDPFVLDRQVSPQRGFVSADVRFRPAPGVEAALSGSMVDLRTFEPIASPYYAASRYRTDAVRGALAAETGVGVLGLNVYRNHADYLHDGPPIAYLGSPKLSPSVVSHAELGYDRQLPALSSTLRTAVFAQRTDDVIADPFSTQFALSPPGIAFRSANVGSSSAVGGEVGLRGAVKGWRWDASYAYVSVSDRLAGLPPESWASFRRSAPTHVVRLGGGYTRGRFEAGFQGRWQSRYRDFAADARTATISPVHVPDYVQIDARVGYRATEHLTLALTANQFNASRLTQTAGRPRLSGASS